MGKIIYKKVYTYNKEVIRKICELIKTQKIRTKNKIEYYDIACAIDTETSLIKLDDNYYSTMYLWQFGVGIDDTNHIIYGRTWEEFENLILCLGFMCQLSDERKLIIYIQNLSYEFSFFCRRFNWKKVFSVRPHKPLFCQMENGIEFRCSYLLSGLSLEEIGEGLTKYKATKKVGDLDYSLIRGPETPLTKKEIGYAVDDIHVLLNYIRETIELDNGITRIPYTKTGYARIYTRRKCFGTSHKKGEGNRKYYEYHALMDELTLDYSEYKQASFCFTGGFCHGNCHYIDKLLFNMGARDISSSYPTQACANGFPMSKPELIDDICSEDDPRFREHLKKDCCIFYMWLYDVESIINFENFLSCSKIWHSEGMIENNGRMVRMKKGLICITEIDYEIMQKCYKWSGSEIIGFRWMKKEYLPKDFIISILSLYKDKTQLKGIEGKEAFYMRQKSILNAEYGMTVTSPVQQLITFANNEDYAEWGIDESKTEEELLEKYNKNRQRFTYYYWGIWICKYAMKQLWDAILYLKNDYVYTDTDSVKYRFPEKHHEYFENYNNYIQKKLKLMCDYYSLPYGWINPTDKKGKHHPMGIWDIEADENHPYKIFKCLGAKRYMYMQDGNVVMTTAGVRKKASDYLVKQYGKYGVFEHYNTNLVVPAAESGKATAYYIDEHFEGDAIDYLGKPFHFSEESCVSIANSDYSLSRGEKYKEFLLGLERYEECI